MQLKDAFMRMEEDEMLEIKSNNIVEGPKMVKEVIASESADVSLISAVVCDTTVVITGDVLTVVSYTGSIISPLPVIVYPSSIKLLS